MYHIVRCPNCMGLTVARANQKTTTCVRMYNTLAGMVLCRKQFKLEDRTVYGRAETATIAAEAIQRAYGSTKPAADFERASEIE